MSDLFLSSSLSLSVSQSHLWVALLEVGNQMINRKKHQKKERGPVLLLHPWPAAVQMEEKINAHIVTQKDWHHWVHTRTLQDDTLRALHSGSYGPLCVWRKISGRCFGMEDEPFLRLPAREMILTQLAADGKVNNDVSRVYFFWW